MAQAKIRRGKRKWYPVHAPKAFNNQLLGETFVYETEKIPQKYLTVNLMQLTGNPKKQSLSVSFKVTQFVEGKADTKTLGIQMQPSSVKRLARRGRTKVADSFLAKTNKEEIVRLKPIVMTRTRADMSVQQAIRAKMKEELRSIMRSTTLSSVVNDVISMRLQKHLKEELSAIFPIRSVDIRYLRYENAVSNDEDAVQEIKYNSTRKPKVKPAAQPKESVMKSLKDELLAEDEAPAKEAKAEPVEAPVEPAPEAPVEPAKEAPAEEAKAPAEEKTEE